MNEPWLEPFLERVRGKVFFDVGANEGVYTQWASKRFSLVHAWEPDPRAYSRLTEFAKCNVVCHQAAVSNYTGKGSLGLSTSPLQSMLLEENRSYHPFGHGSFDERAEVDVVALRDVDMRADWIKIDVEGGEPEVIEGLPDNRASLIIECHANKIEVIRELRAKGYLGERPGIVIDHPLGCPGHYWIIAEGSHESD